jgi:protein TonB
MKLAATLGIIGALLLHAAVLLFGGLVFPKAMKHESKTQEVELLSQVESEAEKKKPEEPDPKPPEEIDSKKDQPPDPIEVVPKLESSPQDSAPALDAASLSAIEAALDQQGGGAGDFNESVSFSSGGSIDGTGKGGKSDEKLESAFNLDELDQKPRVMFQAPAIYPSEVRSKKLVGDVTLIFVVDATGKVSNPKVQKSSNAAFERPAMDALKQWKFEPAVKGGQRVACRMRELIRFQPN